MANFAAPETPSLTLYDPENVYESATSYVTPKTAPATNYGTGAMYGAMAVSSFAAIAGALTQSAAFRAQGDYEASIARTNAAIARLQARQTIEAGSAAASRENLKTQATAGAVRAAQGASGVSVNGGSAQLVQNAIRGVGAQDEITIRTNAARRAWGFETAALQDSFKGKFATLTAKNAANQTLLTGGLKAIYGPLTMETNYLRWSRSQAGPDSVPFPDVRS